MKRLSQILITIFIAILVLEIALRLFGYLPHEMKAIGRDKFQEKAFGLRDSLGIYLKPFQMQKKINGYNYTFSHTSFGTRTTFKVDSVDMPAIALFGCSYTYGVSLDDKDTYPYIADSMMADYNIINYGVPGTGQVHHLIKMEQTLRNDSTKKVKIIVLNYLSFHNERNCAGSNYAIRNLNDVCLGYKNTWPEAYLYMKELSLPFVKCEGGKCQINYIKYKNLIDYELPFIRQSALCNTLSNSFYNLTTKKNELKITIYLLEQIKKICDVHQVKLYISFMEPVEKIKDILAYTETQKIETIPLTIDFNDTSNYNYPIDPTHLSPKANRVLAFKLSEFFKNKTTLINYTN